VIGVAAVNSNGKHASFSTRNNIVHVAVPDVSVVQKPDVRKNGSQNQAYHLKTVHTCEWFSKHSFIERKRILF
jgi:hypothetical protein